MAIDGHRCASQGAGSQRIIIETIQSIHQTFDVSFKHLEICPKHKTDRDRLCMLQMCKTYCNLICILFSLFKNNTLKITEAVQDLVNLLSQVQTGIHLALVITASGSMQLKITDEYKKTAAITFHTAAVFVIIILRSVYPAGLSPCGCLFSARHRRSHAQW